MASSQIVAILNSDFIAYGRNFREGMSVQAFKEFPDDAVVTHQYDRTAGVRVVLLLRVNPETVAEGRPGVFGPRRWKLGAARRQ